MTLSRVEMEIISFYKLKSLFRNQLVKEVIYLREFTRTKQLMVMVVVVSLW
jgi:hypothetical protein